MSGLCTMRDRRPPDVEAAGVAIDSQPQPGYLATGLTLVSLVGTSFWQGYLS